ncbi:MAG: ATP-binding cassette domain-containing protein [Acutalibacter sp.]
MILQAKDLRFSYSKKGACAGGVSLSFTPGRLPWPQRQGKTTCAGCWRAERPQKGVPDGKPLSAYAGPCPVQMVWQHPETVVDPLLPLGKTLAESGMPEQRLLDALHIREGWLTRYPGELSGGELQRFCLARALHPAVKFLLCDESTAMLDLVTQAQIWDFLLREAASRDLGLLVVSHSAALLERVCTRTITLPE